MKCIVCKENKVSDSKLYLDNHCRSCSLEKRRKRTAKNSGRISELRRSTYSHKKQYMLDQNRDWRNNNRQKTRAKMLKKKYGVDQDWYDKEFASQEGRCLICKNEPGGLSGPSMLVIDHDHGTGEIRGLLCGRCNTGIGLFKDNASSLFKAGFYLKGLKNAI